ncbi:MAG: leucine-rich repeat protein [Clostridia bacterium]|nr:leucine-rich repeat protein [Clostridia bacterium]
MKKTKKASEAPKKERVNQNAEENVVLDIPEDEIWTYRIEGLAAPHIGKPYKNYALKKAIFILVIVVSVGLSIYFSIRAVSQDTFKYTELENGEYELFKFSNNGKIRDLTIDYVSSLEYADRNAQENADAPFTIAADETKPVTKIREYAFNCDETLQTVYIGKNVKEIDGKSFYTCRALRRIVVDPANENYCDVDGVLFTKDKKTVICCPIARNKDQKMSFIAEKLIDKYGFAQTVETLSSYLNVEKLDGEDKQQTKEKLFADLREAMIGDDWDTVVAIVDTMIATLDPEDKESENAMYDERNRMWDSLKIENWEEADREEFAARALVYRLPAETETVGMLAFNYTDLETVYLPEGLKNVETLGFFRATFLKEIITYTPDGKEYPSLPDGLEQIGSDAFSYDQALTYVYIPASVKHIGHHAFWDCVYNQDGGLAGLAEINVQASKEDFSKNTSVGDEWKPQYDYMLFKKSVDVIYNAER